LGEAADFSHTAVRVAASALNSTSQPPFRYNPITPLSQLEGPFARLEIDPKISVGGVRFANQHGSIHAPVSINIEAHFMEHLARRFILSERAGLGRCKDHNG
jgi:hypothetical protein